MNGKLVCLDSKQIILIASSLPLWNDVVSFFFNHSTHTHARITEVPYLAYITLSERFLLELPQNLSFTILFPVFGLVKLVLILNLGNYLHDDHQKWWKLSFFTSDNALHSCPISHPIIWLNLTVFTRRIWWLRDWHKSIILICRIVDRKNPSSKTTPLQILRSNPLKPPA